MNHGPPSSYGIDRLALSFIAPPLLPRVLPLAVPPDAMAPLACPLAPVDPDVIRSPRCALTSTNCSLEALDEPGAVVVLAPGMRLASARCKQPVIVIAPADADWLVVV